MKLLITEKEILEQGFVRSALPIEFPDGMFNEETAQKNHKQSLKQLDERGGMHPIEMLANCMKLDVQMVYQIFSTAKALQHLEEIKGKSI